ncbi:MAG: hypothetical protein ABSF61_12990 [Anaerolineales bacterium]
MYALFNIVRATRLVLQKFRAGEVEHGGNFAAWYGREVQYGAHQVIRLMNGWE